MLDLEGTEFIENFIALSLRYNALKSVSNLMLNKFIDMVWLN